MVAYVDEAGEVVKYIVTDDKTLCKKINGHLCLRVNTKLDEFDELVIFTPYVWIKCDHIIKYEERY